ncbi:MAG TPA: hypothetical protein DEG69_16975 [Flavobacteriaceae bacterium]|nr:hypothetical protein [Flavobacteriaceae bacterium]
MSSKLQKPPSRQSYLDKMIGDMVLVISEEGEWHGTVVSVINEDTVVLNDKFGNPHPTDIFKLRSI